MWLTGGKILRHFTGGTTTIDVNTGITLDADENYLAVAGSGPNDVWVLTNKRNLHFDGTWKAYPSGFIGNDTVAHAVIVAANDVWVFRGAGRFAHGDAQRFRLPQRPAARADAVRGGARAPRVRARVGVPPPRGVRPRGARGDAPGRARRRQPAPHL